HPDRRADRDILVDRVGRAVGVGRGRDGELVDVVDRDREGLGRGRAVRRGRGDLDRLAGASRLAVDRRGGGHHPAGGADREQGGAGAAGDRVAHSVGGGIGVRGEGGHPDRRADRDKIGGASCREGGVGRGRDGQLVDVVDRDREGLGRGRAVRRGRGDLDRLAGAERLAVDRRGGGHHPAGGADREQGGAGAAGDRVAHSVGGGIGVRGEGGHPDRRADRDILVDRVGRAIGVGRGRDGELVDVVDRDREGLGRGRPVPRGRALLPYPTLFRSLAVDRRGGGHHPAGGADREQGGAGAAGDRVAHSVGGGIGVGGEGGHPDRRADRDILGDEERRAGGDGRGRDGELVDVVDRDREGLGRGRAVRRVRGDLESLAGAGRLAVDRRGGGHHPAGGADREQGGAGAAGDRVAHSVGGGIGVRGEGGHPDRRADRDIL